MRPRLPVILSAAAFATALLGSTPVGEAAADAVTQIVPRARTADFAKNAGRLQGRTASQTPKAGQIPVLNRAGKLPVSIGAVGPRGAAGPRGEAGPGGPAGLAGYERRVEQVNVPPNQVARNYEISCPAGKAVLGGGYDLTTQGLENLTVYQSLPTSDTTWRLRIENSTGATTAIQLHATCASVSR